MTKKPEEWYGEKAHKFPVVLGDIWQVGPHFIGCGDLESNYHYDFLRWCKVQQGIGVDMVYTDPPWTPALATGYRTKAGVGGKVNFTVFMQLLSKLLQSIKPKFLAMEMGEKEQARVTALMDELGYDTVIVAPITYYKTRPCFLTLAGDDDSYRLLESMGIGAHGMDDEDTPVFCIEFMAKHGETVFDPFTGRGLTMRSAQKVGNRFIGVELNPYRVSFALAEMQLNFPNLPITFVTTLSNQLGA